MVWVMVVVMVRVRESRVLWFCFFPPEPSKECVKVSHVILECRVINHHPCWSTLPGLKLEMYRSSTGVISSEL